MKMTNSLEQLTTIAPVGARLRFGNVVIEKQDDEGCRAEGGCWRQITRADGSPCRIVPDTYSLCEWLYALAFAANGAVTSATERPTWRTKDRLCENCGHGLMAHEQQLYCPPVPTKRAGAGGAEQ